jgi:FAD:protein FMN transferase
LVELEHVMGMPVRVEVRGRPVDCRPLFRWLRHVDAVLSPYRPIDPAQPLVAEVLDHCERLRVATGGAFDAHATGRLDPSGYVKGWAADRAAALLGRAGAREFCLDLGGDLIVRGTWRVGIRHPLEAHELAAAIELTDAAIATSGTYERGEHIYRDGRPARGALSVTVIGPDLASADAFATAAFAMGEEGPAWTARLDGYEAMTILPGGRVLTTGGFPQPISTSRAAAVSSSATTSAPPSSRTTASSPSTRTVVPGSSPRSSSSIVSRPGGTYSPRRSPSSTRAPSHRTVRRALSPKPSPASS